MSLFPAPPRASVILARTHLLVPGNLMTSADTKLASARAFARSLNMLLKYTRLYGFDQPHTSAQFSAAWNELHEAIAVTNGCGLLLGATGSQLLLDGVPVEATPAERSFAQLLSAAGLASIQFTPRVTKEDFERLARAFATQNTEPSLLAGQLKMALADIAAIRINEIRPVAGGESPSEARAADLPAARTTVESSAEILERQFWAAVPERAKREVLTSSEAWSIPARNVKQYVEDLLQRENEKMALAILHIYASCVQSPESEARRRTAIGLAELADVYASLDGRPLAPAIQLTGSQLCVERDDNLQGLISTAFVRLSQEAGARRAFPALVQALNSVDSIEHYRPVFAQTLRPRMGLEKRVPEFLDTALPGERGLEGLEVLLQRVPRSTAENLILRFNHTSSRAEMQRLTDLARAVGEELMAALRDMLRSGSANEAAETAGLLSRLDPSVIQRWLPERLADWPRQAQDRVVRLVAMGGANERGNLLIVLLPLLDPVLLPLAIDEIGLSEDAGCIPTLLQMAEGNASHSAAPFVRLKAVEGLGRLKAKDAAGFLRGIAEGRHMLHWAHPLELRIAAIQALAKINSHSAQELVPRSGLSIDDLSMAPLDPLPDGNYFRRRRYPRVRLALPIPATVSAGRDSYRLEIRGLSLSGGIAVGEKHLPPGSLASMRLGQGLRAIRALVLMRDARAQGLGFEFAEMDPEERTRLRKLLLENKPSRNADEQALLVQPAS